MVVSWNRGTPSYDPLIAGIFHYKPTILDTSIYGKPHTGWGPQDSVQLVYKWFNNGLW